MNKRTNSFVLALFLTTSIFQLQAQSDDCTCRTDLDFLYKKIKKTPPYKVNKIAFEASYEKALSSVANVKSNYACFVLLNDLMLSLTDNHARIYGSNKGATDKILEDEAQLLEFKKSLLYNAYPRPNVNLDSLKQALEKQPFSAVEGIYTRTNYITLGVYKSPNQNANQAMVLASENPMWQVGELMYTLIPYGQNYYLAIGGSVKTKRMVVHTERIQNGIFLTMLFQKNPDQPNFSVALYPESTYLRKELSPETTYLKVGSFNSWYPTLQEARDFYSTLEGTLTKKNVILDLRDNGGGGDNNSDNLFDVLEDYLKEHQVYVLINSRTGSNAEQFAFKMSAFEHCKIFGIASYGAVAYEIKDGTYNLPCGDFIAVLTSKKHKKYLHLESKGVSPDVTFRLDTPWLEQLEVYLEK